VKLLLDQNLSHKLIAAIADLFPGSGSATARPPAR
jgi:hypothetical protein